MSRSPRDFGTPEVQRRRRALVGPDADPSLAWGPWGVAYARGHLTGTQYGAGVFFEGLHARFAHLLGAPRLAQVHYVEEHHAPPRKGIRTTTAAPVVGAPRSDTGICTSQAHYDEELGVELLYLSAIHILKEMLPNWSAFRQAHQVIIEEKYPQWLEDEINGISMSDKYSPDWRALQEAGRALECFFAEVGIDLERHATEGSRYQMNERPKTSSPEKKRADAAQRKRRQREREKFGVATVEIRAPQPVQDELVRRGILSDDQLFGQPNYKPEIMAQAIEWLLAQSVPATEIVSAAE